MVTARYFVSAVGCLSAANVPAIPGLDRFEGDWYHTGAWPKDGVDFTGKRVALIGTGSTGIQATPVIAEQADHLMVFQRTPNYSIPARNFLMSPERTRDIKENYGEIRKAQRASYAGFPYPPNLTSALDVSPEERQATFEALWAEEGGFKFIYGSYFDLLRNQQANDTAAEFIRNKIRQTVKDQEVAEKLCPKDYPYGTKRPPIDTHYFETFNRDNVTLVDLRETPIEEITTTGIRTADQEYELDVIVFATGFDAMTGSLLKIDVRGRDGVALADKWSGRPGYLPGPPGRRLPEPVHRHRTGQPVGADQHAPGHRAARGMDRPLHRSTCATTNIDAIEATEEAEDAWVEHVREVADTTLFPKANSWYLGANIPGKKRVFMPYVGGFAPYSQRCDEIVEKGYEGFRFTSATIPT